MKRNGGLKAYQYELDGKVLRKSQRYYPKGFLFANGHWSFGKKPCSQMAQYQTHEVHLVEWEVTQKEANHLPPNSLLAERWRYGLLRNYEANSPS
mgnify:CR=1 FL=1